MKNVTAVDFAGHIARRVRLNPFAMKKEESPVIVMEFEKGGSFEIRLREDAPQTAEAFLKQLPYESGVLQARFSGTECFFRMPLKVPQENIAEPRVGYLAFNSDHEQAVCIYYGDNIHAANPPYNHFADVVDHLDELYEVGLRIWHEGRENVKISRVE